jgi:hypothetical protein
MSEFLLLLASLAPLVLLLVVGGLYLLYRLGELRSVGIAPKDKNDETHI